jgi:hypothetical protein
VLVAMAIIAGERRKTKDESRAASSFRPSSFVFRLVATTDWRMLCWLGSLALINGLLFLVLMPPWQHYDEPSHFEYAMLIARYNGVPQASLVDMELNRAITDSMYRHHFWRNGFQPFLAGPTPTIIGYDQEVHPPLYYGLLALPLRLMKHLPVEWQLMMARLCSVILFTLTILAIWRITVTLSPDEPLAQICIPLLVLLVPPYNDVMSSVNNDVLVNSVATFMLLGCVLLLRDGLRFEWFALATLSLIVGLMTKRTATVLLFPYALTLFWALARKRVPLWAWVLIASCGFALVMLSIRIDVSGGNITLQPYEWLAIIDRTYLRLNIAEWLLSVSDWERSWPLYQRAALLLFATFWLRFGWSQVYAAAEWGWLIGAMLALGGFGLLVRLFRHPLELEGWQQRSLWIMLLTLVLASVSAMLRIHPIPEEGQIGFLTGGRYTFFAILPLLWLMAIGIQTLIPIRWKPYGLPVLVGIFAVFHVTSWAWTIPHFYYWSIPS